MLPVRPAPCVPLWLAREREADLQIDEGIVNCVGFIGAPSAVGFVADGTCFCVAYAVETEVFHYLVTARHLVRPIRFGKETLPADGTVKIRFSRKEKAPRIIDTRRDDWVVPNDRFLDLAVFPWDYRNIDPDGDLHFRSVYLNGKRPVLMTAITEQSHGPVRMGDFIFIPSLFPGHTGERRNIPVARVGNIAAPPLEIVRWGSPTAPAYLIETKSLGGISGAPVFLHLDPYGRRGRPTRETSPDGREAVPYALIGVVLGLHGGRYAADFIETDEGEAIVGKDVDFNAGISVVLPIQHVIDLLESDPMKAARAASLEAIRKNSGYRPASANRTYPPNDAAPEAETAAPDQSNPTHREDFSRLVGAAAKKRPPADQT
jgi:hypothetical protein